MLPTLTSKSKRKSKSLVKDFKAKIVYYETTTFLAQAIYNIEIVTCFDNWQSDHDIIWQIDNKDKKVLWCNIIIKIVEIS